MFNKRYLLGLLLSGCAVALYAYRVRQQTRREDAEQLAYHLEVWDAETGSLGPSAPAPARPA